VVPASALAESAKTIAVSRAAAKTPAEELRPELAKETVRLSGINKKLFDPRRY
jgi:hypothetical protein